MQKLCSFSPLHRNRRQHHHHQYRSLYEALSSLECVRDRGLDHAVEREKNLKPLVNLKNLIKSEPSKSLPLNLITQAKDTLQIPTRPIEFIRRFPSFFEEFLPGGIGISPHIKLTPSVIDLDAEEDMVYQSVDYKQDAATRLLKLLMVSRINKIPLEIIDRLKWELGLPQDYVNTIVPEFPDYFRVIDGVVLDLVCWNPELAVSVVEKKGKEKIEFPMINSTGFEMDKQYKKWVDEWQKLPYISPYENAMHLASKSDESDKWSVAVLHEVMNLFIGKKANWDNVLCLGECLGIRPRFKLALLQHPGIFYLTSKIGTQMVVLKDGYKRGILIERNPLREMRHKYVKLMIIGKKKPDSKSEHQSSNKSYLKGDHEDGERDSVKKNHDHEVDDDKDENLFQKDTRNGNRRSTRTRTKLEQEVPREGDRRGPHRKRVGKDDTRNGNGRSTRTRTKLEQEAPREGERREPHRKRVSKDDTRNGNGRSTRTRTKLEQEVPREGERRGPHRKRGSKDEVNSVKRIRLKTETPACKALRGKRASFKKNGFST